MATSIPRGIPEGPPPVSGAPLTAPAVNMNPTPAPAGRSMIRIVTPDELNRRDQQLQLAANDAAQQAEQQMSELVRHVRAAWTDMRNHRNSANSGPKESLNERLLAASRSFNGQYDPGKLAEIRKFGGSDVYAKIVAAKVRGATSLLREIYLGPEKPWQLEPTPDPDIPDPVEQDVAKVLAFEVEGLMRAGQPIDEVAIQGRARELMKQAHMAAKRKASEEAKEADESLDDILVEGGFYQALAHFLLDLPLFPFACIKGPEVRMVWDIKWVQGKPVNMRIPRMFWYRVSPYDLYWSPGATEVEDSEFIEKKRYSRASLVEIKDLPGYNKEAIEAILEIFGRGGLHDWMDSVDQARAQSEGRENPNLNRSAFIQGAEYHGSVQARMLLEYGFTMDDLATDDPNSEINVQAWVIDRWCIKVQLSPSPRKRVPYYITSYEKVPGTIAGNALPDILEDPAAVANACLRALVNNMSIASGPQVEIQMDRIHPSSNPDDLYPWKRWKVVGDPVMGTTEKPAIKFWQPESRAQELLGIYKEMGNIGDELSAIPKYLTGSDRMGGAGRTASGLAMLMGNANKLLQTVASNIDIDVIEPSLQGLYDMVMLADAGVKLRGDENIRVRGVAMAQKRELERSRQMEFLAATANPIDMQIVGMEGRAKLLRAISMGVGLDGETIVPDPETIKDAMGALAAPGAPPPPGTPGSPPPGKGPGGPSGGSPVPATGQPGLPAGPGAGPQLNLVQGPGKGIPGPQGGP